MLFDLVHLSDTIPHEKWFSQGQSEGFTQNPFFFSYKYGPEFEKNTNSIKSNCYFKVRKSYLKITSVSKCKWN